MIFFLLEVHWNIENLIVIIKLQVLSNWIKVGTLNAFDK